MRNRYTPGIRHSSVFCCCNVFFDNCYVSEISEMISCAPGFCSLTCFWKQANGTFLRQKMSPVCWILLGCQRQKWGGGTMAWFHRCFLRELGGCNGRVWAKTVVDFRLLMIFGWGGIMGESNILCHGLQKIHLKSGNLSMFSHSTIVITAWWCLNHPEIDQKTHTHSPLLQRRQNEWSPTKGHRTWHKWHEWHESKCLVAKAGICFNWTMKKPRLFRSYIADYI